MALTRFHCPECGFGDYEVGHLTAEDEIYCVVCLEEEDRLIRLQRWEERGGGSGPLALGRCGLRRLDRRDLGGSLFLGRRGFFSSAA